MTGSVVLPAHAHAQVLPEDLRPEIDPLANDDEAVGNALQAHTADAAHNRATFGPPAPAREVRAGSVLVAMDGIRERRHAIRIDLASGLARVTVSMLFVNSSDVRGEVRYRLAVPRSASLDSLEVCVGTRCRQGIAESQRSDGLSAYDDAVRARGPGANALPIAHAAEASDERGRYIDVLAAPVARGNDLEVRVRYLADAPIVGGVVHAMLPARGQDPRIAPAEVELSAPSMLAPYVAGQSADTPRASGGTWFPIAFGATLPTQAPLHIGATATACGRDTCLRVHASQGPAEAPPADILLLIDASPSMEGPARGRVGAAINALLADAPAGSTLRAIAFGASAETVLAEPTRVERVQLAPLVEGALRALGSSTRLENAWALAGEFVNAPLTRDARRKLVVVLGDGGISHGRDTLRAMREITRARIPTSVVNLADRATHEDWNVLAENTRGRSIRAGDEADIAVRGQGDADLLSRLASVFATADTDTMVIPVAGRPRLPRLARGEEVVWEGRVRGIPRALTIAGQRVQVEMLPGLGVSQRLRRTEERIALSAIHESDLSAVPSPVSCDARGPASRASGVNADASPIALAYVRTCTRAGSATEAAPHPTENLGRGIPAETMLAMLRQRIVPAARSCFRDDRRGRGNYSARAVYQFTLADREVMAVDISGSVPEPLRMCLRDAIDRLDVPRFTGTVIVRYPIHTDAVAPEPVLELAPEVARELDARFHGVSVDAIEREAESTRPRPR